MTSGAGIERWDGDGRRDEHVVAHHELTHQRPELTTPQLQPLHLEAAHRRAELGLRGEVGIGHRLLLGRQRVPQRPRAGEPQSRRDLQRVLEARINRLDHGAERVQLANGDIDRRPDLGIDTRVPQRP